MKQEKKLNKEVKLIINTFIFIICICVFVPVCIFVDKSVVLTHANNKDLNDVRILYSIIKEAKANGSRMLETDLDSEQYEWEEGRLISIDWRGLSVPIDLSFAGLDKLRKIDICSCGVKSLDVSQNLELLYLDCSYNAINEVDFSENVQLMYLNCYSSLVKNINISENLELRYLNCNNCSLEKLDISNNEELIFLDVSRNMSLKTVECGNNDQLKILIIDD